MLAGLFYNTGNWNHVPGLISGTIIFNASHPIFSGHFPSVPVVPGVCMIQLVKELLEQGTGTPTRISKAAQIKFLTVINPCQTPEVQLDLQYLQTANRYEVQATLQNPGVNYFKFKGTLEVMEKD